MDQSDTDWGGWNMSEQVDMDTITDTYHKKEDSNLSLADAKSDSVYDSSNMGGEDDYMNNLNFYDGYDSYNEMSGNSSDDDDENERPPNFAFSYQQTNQSTPFRFINGKEGMATCERCGAVGIKHAFYSKSKRFCSLSCSRSFATAQREGKPLQKEPIIPQRKAPGKKITSPGKHHQTPKSQALPKTLTSRPGGQKGFDWGPYLIANGTDAAPVSCFKHCPMSDSWHNIAVGMKLEVLNHNCDLPKQAFWIATVIKIAGYKVLLRYEGFAEDPTQDFWLNLCTQDVHPVGWCATIGKPLVPPRAIQHKYSDWKEYLVKRLTGARTLPSNFYNKVVESIKNHPIKRGMHVEVVDKMCVSAMRVATVDEIIGGRLRLNYVDSKEENDEFWCHMKSPLLHPVGWSQQAGHKLHATQDYKNQCLNKIATEKYEKNDVTPEMFPKLKDPLANGLRFQVGMKLEAIDPLNLSAICVATVTKVLKNNFLMIGIDGSMAQNGSDWFCYHISSPCLFPVGFCEINGLDLTPPRGYKGQFKWFDYLKHTKAIAAPVALFDKEIPKHGFKSGMKIEAVDLMEPRLICVGTVNKVVGRLLKIHFDGWENEYDQWVDCESPDFYPVGWCEVMNYDLEGPRIKVEPPLQQAVYTPVAVPHKKVKEYHKKESQPKKRKGKTQIYKGPRKKRKPKLTPPGQPLMESQRRYYNPNIKAEVKSESEMDFGDAISPPTLSPHAPFYSGSENSKTMEDSIKSTVLPANIKKEPLDIKTESLDSTPTTIGKTALSSLLLSKSAITVAGGHVTTVSKSSEQDAKNFSVDNTDINKKLQTVSPEFWSVPDVCHFLRTNDCASYCDSFAKMNIDGRRLLSLSKEQIANLTGMKVGASLKIFELLQQLRLKATGQLSPS